jgi:hypothetical protein
MLIYDILAVFIHDNARPLTAAGTRALLKHFNWELFDIFPDCPDLVLSDYHLFLRTYLKKCLESQRFNNNDLKEGVKTWLSSRASDLFGTGIQNFILRYYKCHSFNDGCGTDDSAGV